MPIIPTQEVRDIVRQYPSTVPIFEELGIDYCCGGGKTLENACRDRKLALDKVVSALTGALADGPEFDHGKWQTAPLGQLSDHIVERHHAHAKRELPRLSALAAKVHMRHGHVHPELNQLQELVEALASEMSTHMLKEEQMFFPRVKLLENGGSLDSLREAVQRNLEEHSDTGELLESIRALTHNYKLPEDACMSYKALYDGLSAFERETHWHVYLENSILFPRALESEKVPAAN